MPRARAARAAAAALAIALAAGCSTYAGSARDVSPDVLAREPGWIAARGVPLVRQHSISDCGAAAIAMVVSFWTGLPGEAIAGELRPAPEDGLDAGRLRAVARARGLAAYLVRGTVADLERELRAGRPVLVGMAKPHRTRVYTHYEVVIGLHPGRRLVVTLDPSEGWRQNTLEGFLAEWRPAHHLALVVSPPPTARRH
ncbi:MAG TPA: papain-like cysteine protease family protein [Kofleriaceae bacterium]|nr:papain-like cysteine protease family protein [Kofleriaceae bacterium]